MSKASWIRSLGVVCALSMLAVGCGGGEGGAAGQLDTEIAAIQEQRVSLNAKRQEIADLAAQIDAAAEAGEVEGEPVEGEEGEGEEGAAAGPSPEDLQAQLSQAEGELASMGEDFYNNLVMFLNSAGMVEGEEPPAAVLEAIHMKSSEDMLIAREYVDKGGDYRRGMEILDTALMLDPDNPDLTGLRAQFEADQYMTEERFAVVSKGMTMDEVRELLGTVNPHNIRDYPERDVVAWFYRREDKGAAGVYFQEEDGEQTVYRADFDAIKPNEEEEG